MSARLKRLEADYNQINVDFKNHKYIQVIPIGDFPPEKYHVTYLINGIYLKEDNTVENVKRHDIDIILHSDYPRYKPIVKIQTPIFHPNFNDGQVCIGDIWGAGETLSDIILNIGDMIQYQSWNSYSPLSADAAEWAIKNKFMFPVGNVSLHPTMEHYTETSMHEDSNLKIEEPVLIQFPIDETGYFEITSEELKNIKFVPSADRMQSLMNSNTLVDRRKINFKTIIQKGLIWGVLGGLIGWALSEWSEAFVTTEKIIGYMGYSYNEVMSTMEYNTALEIILTSVRISTALFIAIVSGSIGASMGFGEGIYYGSKEHAIKNALKGLAIAIGLGFVFGFAAQIIYGKMISSNPSDLFAAIARGIAWGAAGIGVGLAIGLIKMEKKRVIYTTIGGAFGGFLGGFVFNYIYPLLITSETDTGIYARMIGIIIMGLLIGFGVGMLEQFAKAAWLKVIRGEFEGKEYLVFSGTTSIGNTGTNSIVLFKDKAVSEKHCEIIQNGSKYVLIDKGTPQGTFVNGNRITKHPLRKGDAIGVGNTVLIFNVKDGK